MTEMRVEPRYAGVEVWGSLRVVADVVIRGHYPDTAAERFVDALIDTGARFPCGRGEFVEWAKRSGLL